MRILLVVKNPRNWPLHIKGIEVMAARQYLTDPAAIAEPHIRVFNLCTSYTYQSTGYYVSLLAAARGHRPIPDITTIRDLQTPSIYRLVSDELDEMIQRALGPLQGDRFTLSIYFGRNLAKRYDRLSRHFFNLFRAPLLRAQFVRTNRWQLQTIGLIGFSAVPDTHREFLVRVASEYFSGTRPRVPRKRTPRYKLAILENPHEATPPSDERALRHFVRAGEKLDIAVDRIGKDDINVLPEYDGLFIRETTYVNNHTYRFARRAEAEELVVIDDPASIVRCTNKVYLAELLTRHNLRTPETVIVHRDNVETAPDTVGLPCILKQPDSSYSAGVIKVSDRDEFAEKARAMLEKSELIIAQRFLPTPFDWRVGVIDGRPLYVCKYFMAGRHWQIIDRGPTGRLREGKVETLAVEDAPRDVVRTAVRAANLIGNGLYGVDLKEVGKRCCVIEVNDNPSLDAGYEDAVLKDTLYHEIMAVFLQRMDAARKGDG